MPTPDDLRGPLCFAVRVGVPRLRGSGHSTPDVPFGQGILLTHKPTSPLPRGAGDPASCTLRSHDLAACMQVKEAGVPSPAQSSVLSSHIPGPDILPTPLPSAVRVGVPRLRGSGHSTPDVRFGQGILLTHKPTSPLLRGPGDPASFTLRPGELVICCPNWRNQAPSTMNPATHAPVHSTRTSSRFPRAR